MPCSVIKEAILGWSDRGKKEDLQLFMGPWFISSIPSKKSNAFFCFLPLIEINRSWSLVKAEKSL